MKNRNLVIVILAIICAGLLAGVVYTVTKGKSGTQKKQEASAEAGTDETESQSGIIEEDGKKYYVSNGYLLTNTRHKIDGVIYTFDENGVATPETPHYK